MMDIINIVLTCVFLCVMNTGVIFIMDKISKLMGDNIIHAIGNVSEMSSMLTLSMRLFQHFFSYSYR